MSTFLCDLGHNMVTHKAQSKFALGFLGLVTPRLYALPPFLEPLQAVTPSELFQQFHGNDGANSRKAFNIVATQEVSELHELFAIYAKLARKVCQEEAFDSLGLIEHVLVHPCPAEKEYV